MYVPPGIQPAHPFPELILTPSEALFQPQKQLPALLAMLRMKVGKNDYALPAPQYRATDSGIEIERKDTYDAIDQ